MDLSNTMDLDDNEVMLNRYRTPSVLEEAAKAIPPELVNPPWTGFNDAHALKQGVGPPNEYCYMQTSGCATTEASAGAERGESDYQTTNFERIMRS